MANQSTSTSTSNIILDKVDRGQYLIKNISESDTGRSSQRQNYEFRSEVLKVLSLYESRMGAGRSFQSMMVRGKKLYL